MDKNQNNYICVSYKLYSLENEKKNLEEMTHEEHPFEFISGFGIALDSFEKNIIGLKKGDSFDFTLSKEEAFGDYDPQGAHKLSRDIFCIDGKFDTENIFEGAVITMQDSEGHHFPARVVSIEEDGVTIDTNPPMAGKVLNFVGEVLENREATMEEIQKMVNMLSGEGCCGGHCGGNCEGNCEGDCEGEGHCENHHHKHEGGCGHCHHHE